MKTSPASVGAGGSTATSPARISFSRTMLNRRTAIITSEGP